MSVITRELWKTLKRHVGHTLRCARQSTAAGGFTVDTVSIRCEDCGEVVIEAADLDRTRQKGAPSPSSSRGRLRPRGTSE